MYEYVRKAVIDGVEEHDRILADREGREPVSVVAVLDFRARRVFETIETTYALELSDGSELTDVRYFDTASLLAALLTREFEELESGL